jgi:hypothetical protein
MKPIYALKNYIEANLHRQAIEKWGDYVLWRESIAPGGNRLF